MFIFFKFCCCQISCFISIYPFQSYGVDHLLTFSNLRQMGLLVEQQPGETLTVMESRVGKLVNDRAAGETGSVCCPGNSHSDSMVTSRFRILCVSHSNLDTNSTVLLPTVQYSHLEYSIVILLTDCFTGKLTDAFSSLARKSHFRAFSRRLNLVSCPIYNVFISSTFKT